MRVGKCVGHYNRRYAIVYRDGDRELLDKYTLVNDVLNRRLVVVNLNVSSDGKVSTRKDVEVNSQGYTSQEIKRALSENQLKCVNSILRTYNKQIDLENTYIYDDKVNLVTISDIRSPEMSVSIYLTEDQHNKSEISVTIIAIPLRKGCTQDGFNLKTSYKYNEVDAVKTMTDVKKILNCTLYMIQDKNGNVNDSKIIQKNIQTLAVYLLSGCVNDFDNVKDTVVFVMQMYGMV